MILDFKIEVALSKGTGNWQEIQEKLHPTGKLEEMGAIHTWQLLYKMHLAVSMLLGRAKFFK